MLEKAVYGIWLCALYMAIPCIYVIVGKELSSILWKLTFLEVVFCSV
jgi:hypothetical protein